VNRVIKSEDDSEDMETESMDQLSQIDEEKV